MSFLEDVQKAGGTLGGASPPPSQEAPQTGGDFLSDVQKAGGTLTPSTEPAPEPKPAPQAAPAEQPTEKPITSWSEVPGAAASHLIPSAVSTATAMAQPFIHPIQTYENLRDIGHGILQKAGIMSGQEDTGKVDAVMDYFAKRYGGMQQLRDTIGNDPVGFATDAASLLTGGEMALGKVAGTAAKAAGTVGRAIEPLAAPRAIARGIIPGGARELSEAGVSLTPGQMAGGFGKTVEDMTTSVPLLGSWIRNARVRSIETFNKSVANQVLEPIGETVGKGTKAGHELVTEVEDKLKAAYQKITPTLKFAPDGQYWNEIASIYHNDYPWLSTEMQGKFDDLVGKRISPPGASFKTVESTLSSVTSKYLHSGSATERELGELANKVLIAARENLARTYPAEAAELAKINTGWAMYTRMRNAAARGQEGVFAPSQLLAAVKAGDRSVGKGSFAKGDALMQSFAELGQRVLPSKVPSSGTTERAMMAGALFGEGLLYSPHMAFGIGAGALPYTKMGQAATNLLYKGAGAARKPFTYLPRGTTYQLGKMDESEQEAYDRTRRLFPP